MSAVKPTATPGPYAAKRSRIIRIETVNYADGSKIEQERLVAEVHYPHVDAIREAHATARLLAASWELRETLQSVLAVQTGTTPRELKAREEARNLLTRIDGTQE